MMIVWHVAGLVITGVLCALALRSVRASGAAILGGVIAGALLGPTVLGRLAPDWYEMEIVGGRQERVHLIAQNHLVENTQAGSAAGLDARLERATRERAWQIAQREHQQPVYLILAVLGASLLAVGGVVARETPGPAPHIYQSVSTGAWLATLPGTLSFACLRFMGVDLLPAAMAAACMGAGAVTLNPVDIEAADRAEIGGARLIERSARIATSVAMLVAAWVAWRTDGSTTWLATALLGAPAGWILGGVLGTWRPAADRLLTWIILPGLAAVLTSRIELFQHFSIWPVVLAVIVSGDGRWFGAFVGAMLSGARRSLRTMRLVLGAMSAGPAQLAFVSVGFSAGLIGEKLAYALLLGALVMEVSAPFRRRTAREIEDTEDELAQMRADD